MGVTLKDVAEKAGVSIGTASMALNNSDKVNIETYKKVISVARKLHYVPNARARALVKQSTNIIGLVVPQIINPFFAELAQAVKDSARKKGYNLILCSTDGKADEEARYIEFFKSGMVDGAIFASQESLTNQNKIILEELIANYIPVVNINSQEFGSDLVPVIKIDLEKTSYLATRYLIELGHQRIGFGSHSLKRFEGYKRALSEFDLYNPEFVYFPMQDFDEDIYAIVASLMEVKVRPTAFVCYNDNSAIKMIQLLVEKGIRIPEDISICGTDNILLSRYYNPSLTTINIPKEAMGQKAIEILVRIIAGERVAKSELDITYPIELLKRKSTTTYQG
ncbi:MAG: LacI family transcriptional regulator [Halanaerobiales bacterium]|nr:LacI family transcriptional regulator [Halanaerobiales bacterium]